MSILVTARAKDSTLKEIMNRYLLVIFVLIGVCLAACAPAAQGAPVQPIDPAQLIIFYNGSVLTMEKDQPIAQAIAIRGEKIEAVGGDEEILARRGPETLVIDLAGRTLMPGFVDAHTHVLNDARSQDMSLDQAQMLALRNGITTLGDLYVDQSFLRDIQRFNAAGQLRARTGLYLVYNDPCGRQIGTWYKSYPPTRIPGEMLRINGVKIFTDGGSCGHVALSFDYDDHGLGDLWVTQEALNNAVAEAQAAGYQVAIHAIGDRAVEQAQTAIAFAMNGQPNTYRHRMEHVSVLTPDMVTRFGELGIVPVLNGQYPSCTPFGPPLPEEYGDWEWPWAELRAENPTLPIAWHSDYPFLSINPFIHLYGFVTRNDVYQQYTCKPQDWLRDDVLAVEQALSIMTLESAYALFRETEVGSLRPGKYADLIVISENPLTIEAEQLRRLSVLATMVGGRFEYCVGGALDICPGYAARTPVPLPDTRPPEPVRWLALVLMIVAPLGFGALRWRGSAMRLTLARGGGLAGIAGGGLWLLMWSLIRDDGSNPAGVWLSIVATAAMAVGVVGLACAGKPGWLGWVGLAPAFLGAILLGLAFIASEWLGMDEGWALMMIGLMSHTIGLSLFGLANIKARVLPRFNFLPLVVGLLSGPLPLAASFGLAEDAEWPFALLIFALGLGWVALGLLLLFMSKPRGEMVS